MGTEWLLLMMSVLITSTYSADSSEDMDERIVGGRKATGKDRPPFMAIFNFHPGMAVKCSANIISPFWLTSAAHCIVSKTHIFDGSCLKNFDKAKFQTICEEQPNGDMKLSFPVQDEPSPEVFVGLDSLLDSEHNARTKAMVDFIISHKDGYKGGRYGGYGGYDTIILKTRESMLLVNEFLQFPIKPACLPGPDFQFQNPKIGGYGRYRRVPCETNGEGPSIYNYCKVQKTCDGQSQQFLHAKCDVEFAYNDEVYHGCITDQPTPSASNPECVSLKKQIEMDDIRMYRDGVNELVVTDAEGSQVITKCYRDRPTKHGWCGITNKIITHNKESLIDDDTKITPDGGWGMCSRTCNETLRDERLTGIPRVKDVRIISQEYCDSKLYDLRKNRVPFAVFPQVLCVALNETYQTAFYAKQGDGSYVQLDQKEDLDISLMGRENSWFIRSTGSCKGDSGGPLYEELDGQTFVLLGSTSRGTGKLQNCGGIDNPTHYVRIKHFVPWILSYVGEDNVCIKN
jgi:hypothetical protein